MGELYLPDHWSRYNATQAGRSESRPLLRTLPSWPSASPSSPGTSPTSTRFPPRTWCTPPGRFPTPVHISPACGAQ